MKLNYAFRFTLIIFVVAVAAWFWQSDGVDRGLDLKGGASLTYRLNMKDIPVREHETVLLCTVKVIEARLSHLAYAPEIAEAMLRRQQAAAVVAARTQIVDCATSGLFPGPAEPGVVSMPILRMTDKIPLIPVRMAASSKR